VTQCGRWLGNPDEGAQVLQDRVILCITASHSLLHHATKIPEHDLGIGLVGRKVRFDFALDPVHRLPQVK
jgi:hypothetical protein